MPIRGGQGLCWVGEGFENHPDGHCHGVYIRRSKRPEQAGVERAGMIALDDIARPWPHLDDAFQHLVAVTVGRAGWTGVIDRWQGGARHWQTEERVEPHLRCPVDDAVEAEGVGGGNIDPVA